MGIKINLIRVNYMFLPMPRVRVQTRMGVERMLGCDLASKVCLISMRGYQWPHKNHQGVEVLRDYQGNSSMIRVMTLSCLHSTFQQVLCASGYRCCSILEPLSQNTFRISWSQRVLFIFGLISYLGLETISSVWQEWTFFGYHAVGWQCFLLLPL